VDRGPGQGICEQAQEARRRPAHPSSRSSSSSNSMSRRAMRPLAPATLQQRQHLLILLLPVVVAAAVHMMQLLLPPPSSAPEFAAAAATSNICYDTGCCRRCIYPQSGRLKSDDMHSRARACNIYVSPGGNDGNTGTSQQAPMRSPEAAAALRRQMAATEQCNIHLASGTYYIRSPPLRLGAADSNTTWIGEDSNTVLSGGLALNDTCWAETSARGVYSCQLLSPMESFRVLTVGGVRKQQARFPDYDEMKPYTGGWLRINTSRYIGNNSFVVGVDARALPQFALESNWSGAKIQIFPTRSWINLVSVTMVPVPAWRRPIVELRSGLRHFLVQCPRPGSCTNTSNSASIKAGNRFFIYDDEAALSADEWHFDIRTKQLLFHSTIGPPRSVVVPQGLSIISITGDEQGLDQCKFSASIPGRSPGSALAVLGHMSFTSCAAHCCTTERCVAVEDNVDHCYVLGRRFDGPTFINMSNSSSSRGANLFHRSPSPLTVSDIGFVRLTFADTDFRYDGYQSGFGLASNNSGMPRDAAVVIAGAERVRIIQSYFHHLGGGGIHITNASRYVDVMDSQFLHLGQSGVVLSGDSKTQPTHCTVSNNTIHFIGEILASAAGIMASTTSHSNFTDNIISHTSRWGIAVRGSYGDQSAPAMSYGNRIERNRLSQLAQTTRDLGGLSFIGQGLANTIVRHNCVRDVIGMDMNDQGQLMRPYFTWSLYLDNYASGFTVDSNIFNGNVLGGVFIHGGRENTIVNNIFVNSSNTSMPPRGAYGYCGGAQGVLITDMGPHLTNNTVARNIIVSSRAYHPSDIGMVVFNKGRTRTGSFQHLTEGTTFDDNLYHAEGADDSGWLGWPRATPLGPFTAWRANNYDAHSTSGNPLFRSAGTGDFAMQAASPALKLGFQPLPSQFDQC
jgi:hypothetical protein